MRNLNDDTGIVLDAAGKVTFSLGPDDAERFKISQNITDVSESGTVIEVSVKTGSYIDVVDFKVTVTIKSETPEPELPTVKITSATNDVVSGPAIKATVTITDGIACITTEEIDVVSGSAIKPDNYATVNLYARVTMPDGENADEWEIVSYTWLMKRGDDFIDAGVPSQELFVTTFDHVFEPCYYCVDVVVKSGDITKTISSRTSTENTN